MADDSAIRDFAARNPAMSWKWRTRETPKGWEAEVSIGMRAVNPTFGSGPAFYPTEQEALDRAAMWAIRDCGERIGGIALMPDGTMGAKEVPQTSPSTKPPHSSNPDKPRAVPRYKTPLQRL